MRTADFDFALPPELVAQKPAIQRDASRLLIFHRAGGRLEHRGFKNLIDYLNPGDLLVLNNSKVIPARLHGNNIETHGQFELLLLEEVGVNEWWTMLRPGKRAREGTRILLRNQEGSATSIEATVVEKNQEGHGRLVFRGVPDIRAKLDELGQVPLPPYIERSDASNTEEDRDRYQTVFAEKAGSVAAPTAGLHFTEALLGQLRRHGVQVCFVTLHVGLGTFAPIKSEELSGHTMHEENYEISQETARLINDAKAQGRRVMAVGTTTLRVLESVAAQTGGIINATTGRTRIFIFPPYYFRIVDALVTNFHLPRSSLLMLVSAFAAPGTVGGREMVLSTYAEAIRQKYRFYSYGDAMLIL